MSLGVDNAVLLSDMAFGGADTLATSKVLAEAIRKLNQQTPVDLIICGQQTIDGDTAQVGPGIALRLGFSQLTLVDEIARHRRAARSGFAFAAAGAAVPKVVEAALPALLTMMREINLPVTPPCPAVWRPPTRLPPGPTAC